MRPDEYAEQDATGLAELLRARHVSAEEVYAVAVNCLSAVNEELNAVAHGPLQKPLDYAESGPFAGVPFVLKDMGCHPKGLPVKFGTRLSGDGLVFDVESELIKRFRDAGLAIAAMTTGPEFGMNPNTEALAYGGSTRNPWDVTRSVGGSSGGTAALVAAGAVPVGHASDGGGSIRIPAAYNAVVGLKPTRGRISDGPDRQERLFGLAAEFAITRSMRDCASLLDAVAGAMPGDRCLIKAPERPWARELDADPGSLSIAITTESWSDVPVDPEVAAAVEAVGRQLEDLGHRVVEATPTFAWDAFVVGMTTLIAGVVVEAVEDIAEATGRKPGPETLEHTTWALYEHGRRSTLLDLAHALEAVNPVSRTIGEFFTQVDLLLSPTVNVPPPPLGHLDANDSAYDAEGWIRRIFGMCSFTPLFNWSGTPAISLPLGWTRTGLPIGVQLAAPMCGEASLMRLGSQLEQAMPWTGRRPSVHAG